jgi:hypothetical protein
MTRSRDATSDTVRLIIRGHNLPGRQWGCEAEWHDNIHVGIQERRDPVGLVAGNSRSAGWDVHITVVTADDGLVDFRGPAVQGKRGARFVYLTWGDVGDDGTFSMFRRAKLLIDDEMTRLFRAAQRSNRSVVATVDLTGDRGGPRCARLKPPALALAVE